MVALGHSQHFGIQAARRESLGDSNVQGASVLQIRGVEDFRILDHDFIDAQEGKWTVPPRIDPVSTESLFLMTLEKPAGMPDESFERGLNELDDELTLLARICQSL